jgi:hypothetical protein
VGNWSSAVHRQVLSEITGPIRGRQELLRQGTMQTGRSPVRSVLPLHEVTGNCGCEAEDQPDPHKHLDDRDGCPNGLTEKRSP